MAAPFVIRRATPDDAALIAKHRVAMFTDMGLVRTEELASTLLASSSAALAVELHTQCYLGWFALDKTRRVIAGAGVHLKPQLPRISSDGSRLVTESVAVVLNVYTDPAWRKRGIAHTLMTTVKQWSVDEKIDRLLLHASDAGRPLYVALGFAPTNEMHWSPNRQR